MRLSVQRSELHRQPAAIATQVIEPAVQRHVRNASAPSTTADRHEPRRSVERRHPSAASGGVRPTVTNCPRMPHCQKKQNAPRVSAVIRSAPHSAAVQRAPHARNESAEIHGNSTKSHAKTDGPRNSCGSIAASSGAFRSAKPWMPLVAPT